MLYSVDTQNDTGYKTIGVVMPPKKFFVRILIALVLIIVGTVAMRAAGSTSDHSETAVVKVLSDPVNVNLIGAFDEGMPQITALINPGEDAVFTYRVTNVARVEYIVELHPVFTGEGDLERWMSYQFESLKGAQSTPSGNVLHLMVPPSGSAQFIFTVTLRRDAPVLEMSFVMYQARTNCTELEGCPWG